jgi:hypothetical protein
LAQGNSKKVKKQKSLKTESLLAFQTAPKIFYHSLPPVLPTPAPIAWLPSLARQDETAQNFQIPEDGRCCGGGCLHRIEDGAITSTVVIKQLLGGVGDDAVLLVFDLAAADGLPCSGCCGPA